MRAFRKLIGVLGTVLVFVVFGKSASDWGGPMFQRWAAGGPWRDRRLKVSPASGEAGRPKKTAGRHS